MAVPYGSDECRIRGCEVANDAHVASCPHVRDWMFDPVRIPSHAYFQGAAKADPATRQLLEGFYNQKLGDGTPLDMRPAYFAAMACYYANEVAAYPESELPAWLLYMTRSFTALIQPPPPPALPAEKKKLTENARATWADIGHGGASQAQRWSASGTHGTSDLIDLSPAQSAPAIAPTAPTQRPSSLQPAPPAMSQLLRPTPPASSVPSTTAYPSIPHNRDLDLSSIRTTSTSIPVPAPPPAFQPLTPPPNQPLPLAGHLTPASASASTPALTPTSTSTSTSTSTDRSGLDSVFSRNPPRGPPRQQQRSNAFAFGPAAYHRSVSLVRATATESYGFGKGVEIDDGAGRVLGAGMGSRAKGLAWRGDEDDWGMLSPPGE